METRLLTCREGQYIQRTFTTSDWKDNLGNEVIHERTYDCGFSLGFRSPLTPTQSHHLAMQEPKTVYWIIQMTYADHDVCKKDSTKYGFVIQKEFYCDDNDPHWFPIFKDFDKAVVYLNAKLEEQGETYRYVTE